MESYEDYRPLQSIDSVSPGTMRQEAVGGGLGGGANWAARVASRSFLIHLWAAALEQAYIRLTPHWTYNNKFKLENNYNRFLNWM